MIGALLLLVSISAEPAREICIPLLDAKTSTSTRILSLSEAELYRLGIRAGAVAEGWRAETRRCTDDLVLERGRAERAERRLVEAPPPAPSPESSALSKIMVGGATAAGAGAGAWGGHAVGGRWGAAVGATLGAVGAFAVAELVRDLF